MRPQRLDQRRNKQDTCTAAAVTFPSFTTSRWILFLCIVSSHCHAFVVSPTTISHGVTCNRSQHTSLFLAKKKRRRRKVPPTTGAGSADGADAAAPPETKTTSTAPPPVASISTDVSSKEATSQSNDDDTKAAAELAAFRQVANFAFQPETDPTKKIPIVDGVVPDGVRVVNVIDEDTTTSTVVEAANELASSQAIPLPDIREARRVKQAEQKQRDAEMETKKRKVKIKRSDTAAFTKLLEQEPFADADDSFFEEEAYGTVSALLGERAKPFLGIPLGPLQVGHFIGSLAIILMAFVEYPGFPLTNLPTPLRECFQGGLLTVYAINTVLAVLAAFKAPERGQPIPLWAAKTFAVGGLAYDQLMQLPTTAAVEQAKAVKGKRAIKKRR